MPHANTLADLRDPPRILGADNTLAIPAVVSELCDSADFYAANPLAREDLEIRLATPLSKNMLSDARHPILTTRDELFCTMGSCFDHREGVQPQHFRVWALHSRDQIEAVRLNLREGRPEITEDINVEGALDELVRYCCTPSGLISDRVIASVASAGVSAKIDALFIGRVQPLIDPDERTLRYEVDFDMIYTRPSRRGRGAATAAAWLANDRIEDDLYALDEKIKTFGGAWTLETALQGEVHHQGAECLFNLFEATLVDFRYENFVSSSHWPDWGW